MTITHRTSDSSGPKRLWGMTFTRALGLILVPAIIAGLFLWGLWDPTSRLQSVTAAVVNNDEPVEVEGQVTPLGRVLAAELIGETESENFTWELTNDEGASDGLASGKYVTVVTIPEDFSASATSLADGPEDATQATITIDTSDRGQLLDAALSQAVTQTAARVLNTQLGEAFVGNVFVGFAELGDGISAASDGAEELADGTTQLADGATQLSDGVSQLADGAGGLAAGVGELAGGAGELSGGLSEFASGVSQLERGVGELSAGTTQLADGLGVYADGVQELADGTLAAAGGSRQLAEGVDAYVTQINSVLEPVLGGIAEVTPRVEELRDAIVAGDIPVPDDMRDGLIEAIDQVLGAPTMIDLAIEGGNQLVSGSYASADGLDELADGVQGLAGGAYGLAGGASELAAGTGQLAGELPALSAGAGALADGAAGLASGVDQLASGSAELAYGTAELATGSTELADGLGEAAAGTHDLAEGLSVAAAEIPQYTDAERERLAELAVNPVGTGDDEASLFSGTGAPLFIVIALWAGALALFMLIPPIWARAREAALSEASITVRSATSGMLIGGLQGLIASLLVALVLDASAPTLLAYVGTGALVGFTFALVNQGLVAFGRGFGRFLAFLALIVVFVAGIVSTAPGILGTIGGFTPLGSGIRAFQNIAETGVPGLGVTLMLMVWAALGFIILGAAVHRARAPRQSEG